VIARSQPKHNHAVSHPHLRRQTSSSRRWGRWSCSGPASEFSGVAPGRSDGDDYPVRLQRNWVGARGTCRRSVTMCHKCATGPLHRGGSGRSRGRTQAADLPKHRWAPSGSNRRPTASKSTDCLSPHHVAQNVPHGPSQGRFGRAWKQILSLWPAQTRGGPRRARTDDLRIRRAIERCGESRIPLIYSVIRSQQLVSLGAVLNPSADYLRTVAKSCDGQRSVVAAACEPTRYG